jgi:hypothetical protein
LQSPGAHAPRRAASDDAAPAVRAAALRLLCTLASASPNVNANVLAAFLMERDVYDPLLRLLSLRAAAADAGAEALRPQAAALLALLLTWRESRNAYAGRLAAATPQQLCTLLAACARLLSPPPLPDADAAAAPSATASGTPQPTSTEKSYSELLTDAAAAAGWAAEAVFAAAWAPGTPPRPEALLDSMAARCAPPACHVMAMPPVLTRARLDI